jgi:hypothetical protein
MIGALIMAAVARLYPKRDFVILEAGRAVAFALQDQRSIVSVKGISVHDSKGECIARLRRRHGRWLVTAPEEAVVLLALNDGELLAGSSSHRIGRLLSPSPKEGAACTITLDPRSTLDPRPLMILGAILALREKM